ncbi:MAG TPA: multidrug transporter [Chromatiales bacterium]|nr:multidrug transporter [Chromatiales bacterium]
MRLFQKKLLSYGLVLAMALTLVGAGLPGVAAAADSYSGLGGNQPSAGSMVADLILVRPASLIGTVVTTAVFLVSLPFSLIGGNVHAAAEELVIRPAEYTFVRPLGDL